MSMNSWVRWVVNNESPNFVTAEADGHGTAYSCQNCHVIIIFKNSKFNGYEYQKEPAGIYVQLILKLDPCGKIRDYEEDSPSF